MEKNNLDIKKYQYIDSVRGIAVLLVIIVHVFQKVESSEIASWVSSLFNQGARGVQLFYIVSAFTLFLSMKSRMRQESEPIRNFFIRRFFRIAPLFYIAVFYYLWQDGFGPRYWLGDAEEITVYNIISTLTFTNGFNPYWITSIVPGGWSIAVEMMFYAILPFIFGKIKNIKHAIYGGVMSLVSMFVLNAYFTANILITDNSLWNNFLFLYFPSQLPIFFLGIILYFIIVDNDKTRHSMSKPYLCVGLLTFIFISMGYLPVHYLISIGFVFFVYALFLSPIKIFVNKLTAYIGMISFSMYLTHFSVLHFFGKIDMVDFFKNQYINYFTVYILVVLATVLLSTITYFFIEKPGQAMGKNIILNFERRKARINALDKQNVLIDQGGV